MSRRAAGVITDVLVACAPLLLLAPVLMVMAASGSDEQRIAVSITLITAMPVAVLLYFTIAFVQAGRGKPTAGRALFALKREHRGWGYAFCRYVLLGAAPALLLIYLGLLPLLLLAPISTLIAPDALCPLDRLSSSLADKIRRSIR